MSSDLAQAGRGAARSTLPLIFRPSPEDEGEATDVGSHLDEALPPGPRLITPDGHSQFRHAYERLLSERPALVAAKQAREGDVADEHALRSLDRRVAWLTRRLPLWTEPSTPQATDRAVFGAWVTVVDEAGRVTSWRIVGPDEVDAAHGYISVASPVAMALIGKRVGDEVTLRRPKGDVELTVTRIEHSR